MYELADPDCPECQGRGYWIEPPTFVPYGNGYVPYGGGEVECYCVTEIKNEYADLKEGIDICWL